MTNIKNKQLLDWLISRSDTTLEINDKRYDKYDIRYIFLPLENPRITRHYLC